MTDKNKALGEEVPLKRYTPRAISPLDRIEGNDAEYRQQREEELREIIKGPAPPDDWHQAQEELRQLRGGTRWANEQEEWEFGR